MEPHMFSDDNSIIKKAPTDSSATIKLSIRLLRLVNAFFAGVINSNTPIRRPQWHRTQIWCLFSTWWEETRVYCPYQDTTIIYIYVCTFFTWFYFKEMPLNWYLDILTDCLRHSQNSLVKHNINALQKIENYTVLKCHKGKIINQLWQI